MAYRTWGRVLLAALGVALLAGAGQLGLAYGLGIVRFARDFEAVPGHWTAQLAWVAWFAMTAAIVGALAADRLARNEGYTAGTGSRIAYAVAAGVGACAVAPLSMLPAQGSTVPGVNPVMIAGLSAMLGAVGGVFAALGVLAVRTLGWNVAAVTELMWLLALISVAPSLGPDDPLPEVRLGVFDPSWLSDGTAQRLAVMVMPALALAAGAGVGVLARWRNHPVAAVAASGAVGPAMLALAYLIAGPGAGDRYQSAPYWGAIISVGAGALGSVLAAVAQQLGAAKDEFLRGRGRQPTHGTRDHTAEVFPAYGDDPRLAPWERSSGAWDGGRDPDDRDRDRDRDSDEFEVDFDADDYRQRERGVSTPSGRDDDDEFDLDDPLGDRTRGAAVRGGAGMGAAGSGARGSGAGGLGSGAGGLGPGAGGAGAGGPEPDPFGAGGARRGDRFGADDARGSTGASGRGAGRFGADDGPSAGSRGAGLGAAGAAGLGVASAGLGAAAAGGAGAGARGTGGFGAAFGSGDDRRRPRDDDPLADRGGNDATSGRGGRRGRGTDQLDAPTGPFAGGDPLGDQGDWPRAGRPGDLVEKDRDDEPRSASTLDLDDGPEDPNAPPPGLGNRPGDDVRTQQRTSLEPNGPVAGRRPEPLFTTPPPPQRPEARPARPAPPPLPQPAPPIAPPPITAPVVPPRDWRRDQTETFAAQRDEPPPPPRREPPPLRRPPATPVDDPAAGVDEPATMRGEASRRGRRGEPTDEPTRGESTRAESTRPGSLRGEPFGGESRGEPTRGGLFGDEPTRDEPTRGESRRGGLFGDEPMRDEPARGGLFGGEPTRGRSERPEPLWPVSPAAEASRRESERPTRPEPEPMRAGPMDREPEPGGMPDWRLAGPAWAEPDDEPPVPAPREKRRGLFGRKRATKAEAPAAPTPPAPTVAEPVIELMATPAPARPEPAPARPEPAPARPVQAQTSPAPAPTAPAHNAPDPVDDEPPSSTEAPPPPKGRGRKKAKRDEEYVDWVAGLSAPEPEERPRDTTPRRSLRSGRHSTDTE